MRKGFTKIPNTLLDQPWATNPVVVYLYVWLSLHADEEGRVSLSLNDLVAQTGLNKMQIRRALEKLKVTQFVTQQTTQKATHLPNVITICFLGSCKVAKSKGDTPNDTASDTDTDTPSRVYKNDNIYIKSNIKTIKDIDSSLRSESDISLDFDYSFESFWRLYDKKVDKKAAMQLYEKILLKDRRAIFEYIPRYKRAQPNKQYRKSPARFLRNRSWEDEIIGDEKPQGDATQLRDNSPEKFQADFWGNI